MFCIKCGEKMNEGEQFCNNCGASVYEKEKKNYWRFARYIWTVIVNLITIGVVIAIYSNIYDSFEVIVVSLLILIYLSIQTFATTSGNTSISTAFYNHEQFSRIRKLLKNSEVVSEDEEYENEEFLEAKKKFDKAKTKMYINIGFAFIIYIIALFNLLGAL